MRTCGWNKLTDREQLTSTYSAGRSCSRSCARYRTPGTAPPSSRLRAGEPRNEDVRPFCNTPATALCASAKAGSVTHVPGMRCYPSLRKGSPHEGGESRSGSSAVARGCRSAQLFLPGKSSRRHGNPNRPNGRCVRIALPWFLLPRLEMSVGVTRNKDGMLLVGIF